MIGEAAALGAALCWAIGSHLWGRIARSADVAPGALNLGKCAAGALVFAATGLVVGGRAFPDLPARPTAWLALSGVLGLTLGDGAYFGAMSILGVRRALLLLSTAPVFTAMGGALWLGEPPRPFEVAAIAAVLAGVGVVVREQPEGQKIGAARGTAILGVLLGIGSGVGQAAGSLVSRAAMDGGVSPLDTALVRVPAALAGIVILAGATGRLVPWTRSLARPRLLAAIAGAAFVGTYLGIWLAQLAIGRASSTAVASTLLATSPIFALPLGRWLNAERITPRALGGTVLACAGLAGLTLGKS
jgi:drug/metabolite transporter (DMT)-like permease